MDTVCLWLIFTPVTSKRFQCVIASLQVVSATQFRGGKWGAGSCPHFPSVLFSAHFADTLAGGTRRQSGSQRHGGPSAQGGRY